MKHATGAPHKGGSGQKVASNLVVLGSAAVLTVYGAGYAKTKAAADRFASLERSGASAAGRGSAVMPPTVATEARGSAARPDAAASLALPSRVADSPVSALVPVATPIAASTSANPGPGLIAVPPAATVVASRPVAPTSDTAPVVASPVIVAPTLASVAAPAPVSAPPPAPAPDTALLAVAESVAATVAPPTRKWKDGTYEGWGSCRHGDLQASLVIAGGRIVSATISQCLTRYPCSWISPLPPQVVERQGPNIDYVSGATQSADAFYGAVTEALSKAK